MGKSFVHLHVHTDYSMLDGLGKPAIYVDEAARRGDPALAITDHGTLSGVYEFYMACMKAGIRPIIGQEFYFVPNADIIKDEKIGERFHVVVLANNYRGFLTLIELNNQAHQRFYYKPVIDRSVCEALAYEEAENLTVLSGCAASIISRKALGEIPGSASVELQWWRETFPNFYIELQHHNTHFDRKLNGKLLKLSRRYDLPWVITNDPHYVTKDQCDHHDALLAIQTASHIDDEERFRFTGSGYHLKTRREMEHTFRRYEQSVWKPGIRNTLEIAKNIDIKIPEWDKKSWHIPKFRRLPKGKTSYAYLRHLTIKGLQDKGLDNNREYVERAKQELRDIKSIEGFADFLLITREIIQWAVANKNEDHPRGIPVGPGRGSTAGCLVGYLIGVHKVDSIRGGLLFERFLNPARPKMPDIDTDFSKEYRPEVIEHIADEYGAENVLPVAAFQTMKVRGAFRKLATAMGMPFPELKKFTDIMAEAWGKEEYDEDDDTAEEEEEHIRVEHLPEELVRQYPDVVNFIEGIIGTKSAISRHAAGIIIFDPEDSIRQCVPEMWVVSSKRFAAAFNLQSAEGMGLMKQDILGLRTLDTIDQAVTLIEEQTGELLDPDSWIPDEEEGDVEVFKMMAGGHNNGVFQIEGGTMATGITKIKPKRFDDVVVCTSIYRKGPMIAGAPDRYIANKKAKQIKVMHPALKPILSDSYGEMAYQEQLMRIASDVAGFDQGGVADLLAAVRFKDEKMMAPLKDQFIKGCDAVSGIEEPTALKIWSMLEKQSSYLFNKSHAYAYTLLTYQTARLKCWWPLQYLTALMRTVKPDDKGKPKRQTYLAEAMDYGFKILPPDVNRSGDRMTCGTTKKGVQWMRFGFSDIKGIGMPTAKKILAAREAAGGRFKSMKHLNAHLTPGLVKKLDQAGCLDAIGGSERNLGDLEGIVYWQFDDIMVPYRQKYTEKVKLPGRGDGRVKLIGEVISHVTKKTKNGKHYMTWRIRWSPSEIFTINIWEDAESAWHTPVGSIVLIEGKYSAEYRNVSVGDVDQIRVLRYSKKKVEDGKGK